MEKYYYLTIVLTIYMYFSKGVFFKKFIFENIFNSENAQFIYEDIVIFLSEYEISILLAISTVKVEKGFNHNVASIEWKNCYSVAYV
ncbi:hypothetical protein VSU16_16690 (plasmid) [Cetobacterium somerae]|uniref:hypothetical protein n=1 Tax=Cetobacterium somerae TaxID=188913 RepID=UPI002E7B6283|nr:hypothetical protein [Cetobacterium somerae]WVJ03429.1 hypothetical protein VSU16_16690 [Cetobacterium somerae]